LRRDQIRGLGNASWVDVGQGFEVLAMSAPPAEKVSGGGYEILFGLGIRRAAYLLDPWGLRSLYGSEEALARLYLASGIQPHWVPTPNLGIPRDLEPMRAAVSFLLEGETRSGVVHCRAGVGRTGLLLTCLMVELGATWQQARKSLGRQRYPLQSSAQVEFLRRYAGGGR
jgi:hypothetical protein